ncbi:phosphoinositide phosphatase SAC3-like [Bidens hawaiensis]|uniref:phosphoinositide phosphatase SAC3-like n=1 Tax=Bidens hawaiensis TaxID=980011 RepID=UPI004049B1CD
MVGRDNTRTHWRVLKIDKGGLHLNIREDSTTYTEHQCSDLLTRIDEGNKSTGGLAFLTTCYGIVGFIKFLGPYYMLLITQRRLIGSIGGHPVYAISKTEMIALSDFVAHPNSTTFQHENRYKKLLCMLDLTKDFFFSYSYHVMRNLQKNTCCNNDKEDALVLYETMFVWNEFLTRGVRNLLQNTMWTVALVYGFFDQDTLSISGRDFKLTLISRRSRHYAGTRYLKRGVNEKGRVANDVETEQILFEDVPEGYPMQITSVVQNRGSIPLFWSQETSRLNIKPDITLSRKDQNYEATRLHFQNLVKRYGNPIIILNLIKTTEKRPRESILRTEFANAIKRINEDLSEENRLKFLHWDLHKHSRSKGTNALLFLSKLTTYALTLTGFFYCQVMPSERWLRFENNAASFGNTNDGDENGKEGLNRDKCVEDKHCAAMFQQGVLRTNCIDCLDRTNVAQYAYGLSALGHQLHALGAISSSKIDLDDPLAQELMGFYERMGDTLAYQYGGSAAHNKVFSEKRGQWKAATQSQEFFRTLQRYYNNAYMDAEKQNAINVFLGHFQPQDGRPEVWELDSDQNLSLNSNGQSMVDDDRRSLHKKSLSDGNIIRESKSHATTAASSSSSSNAGKSFTCSSMSSRSSLGAGVEGNKMISESTPDISAVCEPCSRWREGFEEDGSFDNDQSESHDYSNFVDLDWLSSCDEESLGRSFKYSSEKFTNEIVEETTPSTSESSIKGSGSRSKLTAATDDNDLEFEEYSDSFLSWVNHGEALCH